MNSVYVEISLDQNGNACSYAVSSEPFTPGALDPQEPIPVEWPCPTFHDLCETLIHRYGLPPADVPPREYFEPTSDRRERIRSIDPFQKTGEASVVRLK